MLEFEEIQFSIAVKNEQLQSSNVIQSFMHSEVEEEIFWKALMDKDARMESSNFRNSNEMRKEWKKNIPCVDIFTKLQDELCDCDLNIAHDMGSLPKLRES